MPYPHSFEKGFLPTMPPSSLRPRLGGWRPPPPLIQFDFAEHRQAVENVPLRNFTDGSPEKQKTQPVRIGLSQVLLVVMGRIELPTYGL